MAHAAGAAALAVALVGCGSDDSDDSGGSGAAGGGSTDSVDGTALVSTQEMDKLGTVLVDRSGRALYFADQETDGTIRCVDACLELWKPVKAAGASSSGISGLDTIRRDDTGVRQLTYDGAPLYTFTLDRAPGQVTGDDLTDSFGGVEFTWHAAVTDEVAGDTGTDSDDGSGYGGGYGDNPYGY